MTSISWSDRHAPRTDTYERARKMLSHLAAAAFAIFLLGAAATAVIAIRVIAFLPALP